MCRTSECQAARTAQEEKAVEKSVSDYYALSAKEVEEQARWGDLALANFPKEAAVKTRRD
jgi:hypothetical protein